MRTDRGAFAGRATPVSAAFSGAAAGFDMSSLRVLVFEDNARDCALIRKFLEAAGVRASNIHHADTIPSALQVLRREPVDLVLADYYLQPHTGLDLIDETRHSEFDVPFIVMSALDDTAIDQQALLHGAYGFLVKGELTVERLDRAIRYALAGHRRESALGRGAARDTLTGLLSRASFIDSLAASIAYQSGKSGMIGLALFEIGALGEINHTLGLTSGDEALRLLGQRLRRVKGPGEAAARIDGNEFALMMTDFLIAPHAATRGRDIAHTLGLPLTLGATPVPVHLSTGVAAQAVIGAEAPRDFAERLMLRAGHALREARQADGGLRLGFAHVH
ncbi:MAG: diguanylate cyclase domain-containing protein [Rhodospirillaceae bacterium]